MKTHNRILFHCLCCGRVVHAEPEQTAPNCCGKRMINAAAETVWERDEPFVGQPAEPVGKAAPRKPTRQIPR